MSKSIVLFSAGLDSAAVADIAAQESEEVELLYIDYGSRQTTEELKHSSRFLQWLQNRSHGKNSRLHVLTLDQRLLQANELNTAEPLTVESNVEVYGRNLMFLALANARAEAKRANRVYIGTNLGHLTGVHADASPHFIQVMNVAIAMSSSDRVELRSPLARLTKGQIWLYVHSRNLPVEHTYSCYAGTELHCGVCDACVVRRTSAESVRMIDTTTYVK